MKHQIKTNPQSIGDLELEWLTPVEVESYWSQIKKVVKNNEQPFVLHVDIEHYYLLDQTMRFICPLESSEMLILDTTKK